MLLVLFVVFVAIAILVYIFVNEGSAIAPSVISVFVGIALLICAGILVDGRVIDQKLEVYTEENLAIEKSIGILVSEYMDFESETLRDLKGESSISLISLYPELKSDELVKTQIELYRENNDRIRTLKESKLNLSAAKWWLYFGS